MRERGMKGGEREGGGERNGREGGRWMGGGEWNGL